MGMLYVVQGYHDASGEIVADKPILHGLQQLALSRGEQLAGECEGVLVYAQSADVDRGEYSEPVILASYGRVPVAEGEGLRASG